MRKLLSIAVLAAAMPAMADIAADLKTLSPAEAMQNATASCGADASCKEAAVKEMLEAGVALEVAIAAAIEAGVPAADVATAAVASGESVSNVLAATTEAGVDAEAAVTAVTVAATNNNIPTTDVQAAAESQDIPAAVITSAVAEAAVVISSQPTAAGTPSTPSVQQPAQQQTDPNAPAPGGQISPS